VFLGGVFVFVFVFVLVSGYTFKRTFLLLPWRDVEEAVEGVVVLFHQVLPKACTVTLATDSSSHLVLKLQDQS
jgi:hypothetical protein